MTIEYDPSTAMLVPCSSGPFVRTVAALSDTLVRERCAPDGRFTRPTATVVLRQVGCMPVHLRAPLRLITLLFAASPMLRLGRPFHAASETARHRHLERWRRARLGVRRDFVRFWEHLIVFAWFSVDESDGR